MLHRLHLVTRDALRVAAYDLDDEADRRAQGLGQAAVDARESSLGAVAPAHRGAHLARAGLGFSEHLARALGMGFVFGMATLKTPYAQRAFEAAGWRLIGIAPGYDRSLVAPGEIRRIYEGIYAKLLASDAALLYPLRANLTAQTRALFDLIFPNESGLACTEDSPPGAGLQELQELQPRGASSARPSAALL